MSYQVFARKWRPQNFEEMVGQAPVARTLLNAIQNNRLAHAYLFAGARGVGKTSMARLLAKAVNCEKGPTVHPCGECILCKEIAAGISVDVLEIDGASNRGIDNIRELKDQIKYAPLKGKYKIYIIDEVHMLTSEAFNALLKTLEEPPPNTIFVLATTELHKIPSTILSRCQQFHFKKISRLEIMDQLKRIIQEEKIQISEKGLLIVAKAANGSMRDSLSILDQIVSFSGMSVIDEDIRSILGVVDTKTLYDLTEALSKKNVPGILTLFREVINAGHDLKYFCQEWISHIRSLLMMQIMPDPKTFLDLPEEEISDLSKLTHLFSLDQLQRFLRIFTRVEEGIRFSSQPSLNLEIAFIQSATLQPLEPIQNLIERINSLSDRVGLDPAGSIPSLELAEISNRRAESSEVPITQPPKPSKVFSVDAPSTDSHTKETQEIWSQLIHVLKEKKPNLESYLKQSLWMTEEKGVVKIGYPENSPFFDFLKKEETLIILADECMKILKKPISIQITGVKESDKNSNLGPSVIPKRVEGFSLVQKVQETLGGKVVEVKDLK
ncbi:MAG: DNA polymerase III subunit gamma/tau [Nitrospiria bacterium]